MKTKSKRENVSYSPRPLVVFHGHHDEIICLVTNAVLGIAVSSDKSNCICIHDTLNPKILTNFSLNSEIPSSAHQIISKLFLSPAGYLIAGSTNKFFLCNLSGEKLETFEAKFVNFLDSLSLKLVTPHSDQLSF